MNRATTGLTLIELVAAIALMGFVLVGSGWWIRTSMQRAADTTRTLRHEAALEALFAAIERDLAIGDLIADSEKTPRISTKPGALTIATRSRAPGVGAVLREYVLLPGSGKLTESEHAMDAEAIRGAAPTPRVVLGDVRSLEATVDEKAREFQVAVTMLDGASMTRRWVLP